MNTNNNDHTSPMIHYPELPAKVARLARYLDRNSIPYTITTAPSDINPHSTFYTLHSADGSWAQDTVTTMFCATTKHTTVDGKTKPSTVRHLKTWVRGLGTNSETDRASDIEIMWRIYAVKGNK